MLTILGVGVMIGIIAAHFALLNRGAWGGDEYVTIARFRALGFTYMWPRFSLWSPRPLYEALIVVYASVVLFARQPLIVPVLLPFWLAFMASVIPAMRPRVDRRILVATAVPAFILLGKWVFYVFYWPMGTMAYLPGITAAVFLLFAVAGESRADDPVTAAVLVAAAWSSEAGALFVLTWSALRLPLVLADRGRPAGRWLCWAVPVIASVPVMLAMTINIRAHDPMPANGDPAFYHHLLPSLFAAAQQFVPEFLSVDGETFDASSLVTGTFVRLLFVAGVYCGWPKAAVTSGRRSRVALAILGLALMVAAFGTLVAGFRQFGEACCRQHSEMRHAFGFIALACLAIGAPPVFRRTNKWPRVIAPGLLVLAAIPLLSPRFDDMAADFRYFSEPEQARRATWRSGSAPGAYMKLCQPPADHLFPAQIPPGTQFADDNWWTEGIVLFFFKEAVQVVIADRHGTDGCAASPPR
jgi:hypothetical protein